MRDDIDLQRRLRALGRHPVEPAVATAHLSALGVAGSGRLRTSAIVTGAAAAVVAVLVVAGIGLASRADAGPSVSPATSPGGKAPEQLPVPGDDTGDDEPTAPMPDEPAAEAFECTGPPPWAGTPPESGESRAAESQAFEDFRATECPDDDPPAPEPAEPEADEPVPSDEPAAPGSDTFECTGPPPWAGTPPVSGESRAAEAQALSEFRSTQCPDDDAGRPEGAGPPPHAGRPEGAGPPPHAGRPDHAGPKADRPGD
ncbi:MAG: hypothetical protein MUE78_04870 [Ilumatobacteraceae bacterium]|jgi:hypothetical protein|nr:hypothetical protein [Ilumatobacteraceae bacterium]